MFTNYFQKNVPGKPSFTESQTQLFFGNEVHCIKNNNSTDSFDNKVVTTILS